MEDSEAAKAKKGHKFLPRRPHKLMQSKKETRVGLGQKAMQDYGREVLDDANGSPTSKQNATAQSIKSPRKSGSNFSSFRRSTSSKSASKVQSQFRVRGANAPDTDASGNEARPQDMPSVSSQQSRRNVSPMNEINPRLSTSSRNGSKAHSQTHSNGGNTNNADIKGNGSYTPNGSGPNSHLTKNNVTYQGDEPARKMTTHPKPADSSVVAGNYLEELYPWKCIGNFNHKGRGMPDSSDARLIKAYILENFLNDWYYNVAVIVGTCVVSWAFAYCGFSWWSLMFILICTGAVLSTEYRRFNRNVRDDLKRVTVQETLSQRTESTVWLNSFMSKFWVIYMPVLSQQVKDIVNPSLAGVAPGFGIDALSLAEFTLGSKAPAIQSISTNTKTDKGAAEMVFTFAFTPNDVSDMTPVEAKEKINPRIVLAISLGKSFVSKKMNVIMEDINVTGKMRTKIIFGDTFPNIRIVSIQMVEAPIIEFALKPLGGDTLGLDVMSFLPGLKSFVQNQINANVGPMLYAPNHFDVNIEDLMATQANDAAGVLAITIANGDGLKGSDFITNTVDPYITFELEKGLPDVNNDLRTTVKSNTTSPRWNETKYILLSTLNQKMRLKCFDFNDVRKDTYIGEIEVDLADLLGTPSQDGLSQDLKAGTKPKGRLNYSMHWFPAKKSEAVTGRKEIEEEEASEQEGSTQTQTEADSAKDEKKDIDDSKKHSEEHGEKENGKEDDEKDEDEESNDEEEEETDAGIAKLTLQNIKFLNISAAASGTLSPSVTLSLDDVVVKNFRTLRHINEPAWGETIEVFVPSREESELKLEVFDHGLREKKLICEYSSSLEEMFQTLQDGPSFVKGTPQGEIYISADWKPVSMSGLFASGGMRDPIGALRVHVRDINVVDDLSGIGDIDPYFTLSVNRHVDYKSISYSETEHAYFEKVEYLTLLSDKALVNLAVYDYQTVGDDRYVGSAQIPLVEVLKKDSKTGKYQFVDDSKKTIKLNLQQKSGKMSSSYVNISLSFVPCVAVYTPDEYQTVLEKETQLKQRKKEFWDEQATLKDEMKNKPENYEIVKEPDPFEEEEKKLHKKVGLSLEQLLRHNAGVLNLQFLGGTVNHHDCFLQVCVDDIPWPKYTSSKIYGDSLPSDSVNVFIRDLRNSKLLFRFSDKRVPKEEHSIISEFSCNTYQLLKTSYNDPSKVNICGSILKLQCLYTPTSQRIPVSDTVLDTGVLKLKVVSAANLMSADRNGYSDPFFTIDVDGRQHYHSQVVKKTLSPTWNETAEVPVPSRTRKKVKVMLYDWDRAGDNDDLGFVELDLFAMIPKKMYDWELPVSTQGSVKLQACFFPQYNKPLINLHEGKKKSKLGHIATAPSGLAHTGFGLAHGGARLLKKPFMHERSKRKSIGDVDRPASNRKSMDRKSFARDEATDGGAPDISPQLAQARASLDVDRSVPNQDYALVQKLDPESQLPVGSDDLSARLGEKVPSVLSGPVDRKSFARSRSSSNRSLAPGTNYQGTVTLVSSERLAKHVQLKVSLAVGGKIRHLYKSYSQKEDESGVATFDESFNFQGPPEATLVIGAISHHMLTKDKDLGIAQIALSDPLVQQGGNISVELGRGFVVFRLTYGKPTGSSVPPVPPIPQEYQ
ncbi:related to Tricalbin-3 [Zygosaccharomyces bailii]|nr:related to Tricalbin-3 [Zygosaccharomyces bailii]